MKADETQIGGSQMPSPFGIRLRQFREAKGLTLEQVADDLGCTKAYVWELEMREVVRPTAKRLNAIGKLLGVKVEDLLGEPIGEAPLPSGADVTFYAAPKDVAFFREYAGMSEDEKKRYRDAMKLMFGSKGSDAEGA